jgi:hypothetical protein
LQCEYKLVSTNDIEWQFIYNIARNDKSHGLWQNYQNIDLSTYEHMIVNLIDGYPSAFHGIYNNGRWPESVSRICNRAYINPVCQKAGDGLKITSDNIKYVLDNYTKWNKDVLFISRGVQYDKPDVSFKKFQKFVKYLERTTGYKLEYDDRLYTCCDKMCRDCYQYCVWYDPKHVRHTLDIPSLSIDEWYLLAES